MDEGGDNVRGLKRAGEGYVSRSKANGRGRDEGIHSLTVEGVKVFVKKEAESFNCVQHTRGPLQLNR